MTVDPGAVRDLWMVVALGTAAMVLATGLACKAVRAARWQRLAWLACLSATAGLLVAELAGAGAAVVSAVGFATGTVSERSAVLVHGQSSGATVPGGRGQRTSAGGDADGLVSQRAARSSPARAMRAAGPLAGWLSAGWFAVAGLLLGRLAVRHAALAAFVARHGRRRRHALAKRLAAIGVRVGMRRPVSVMEAACIHSPIALGLFRPTIGLPSGFISRHEPLEQDVMLAHELTHLAGRDPAWRLLADAVVACLWWHPGAWWMRLRLIDASEVVADEASQIHREGPRALAECLVRLARESRGRLELGWLGVGGPGSRSRLGRRIGRLVALDDDPFWRPPCAPAARLLLLIAVIMLVPASFVFTAAARSQPPVPGGNDMRVIDASWRRSVAGGVLLAAFTGQGLAAGEVAGQAAAGGAAAAGGSDAESPETDEPPAAVRQAEPNQQRVTKPKKTPRAKPARGNPSSPIQRVDGGGVGGGVGGAGGVAGGFDGNRWEAGQWDALAGRTSPAEAGWRPTPSIHRELGAIVNEFARRGASVRGQGFGKGTGVKSIEVRLGFTNTEDTDPIDKTKIMERIDDAFLADMRRINKNHEAVLTCMLTFRDRQEPCRLVTKKHRDRIVSLAEGLGEDKGQLVFQQRGADGKVVQQWDVTEDPKGENLPPEIRSDLPELVLIMETVAMGSVGFTP